MAFHLPLLAAAISSLNYWMKFNGKRFIYLFGVVAITWLTVMLTCDDWHNRFYLGISPYIIILSLGFFNRYTKQNRL